MPPTTRRPEGTPHSRRTEYIIEQLRRRVRPEDVVVFSQHAVKMGEQHSLRLPADAKDFPRVVRRLRNRESGAVGWNLDLVELGLQTWHPAQDEKEITITTEVPTLLQPHDHLQALYMRPKSPADLVFLMDAIPKLDAMSDQERHAAINYIRDRYYPGRGMADV
jgi:hypothetical protein